MTRPEIKATLYASSVQPLADRELYRMAYCAASPERRKKADAFRMEKDRRLCLGAEILLRYGLREANAEYDYSRIKKNDRGKPFIENMPLHFSISHSGDWVVCAVSSAEVGCDIEEIQSSKMQLARRFFCPEEYAHLLAQKSEAERRTLFYRYWTLKESFIKATGLGMALPLNKFCIKPGEPVCVGQSLDKRSYSFAEFEDIPGYRCAVCVIGENAQALLNVPELSSCLAAETDRLLPR